jgi:hypothetical protein
MQQRTQRHTTGSRATMASASRSAVSTSSGFGSARPSSSSPLSLSCSSISPLSCTYRLLDSNLRRPPTCQHRPPSNTRLQPSAYALAITDARHRPALLSTPTFFEDSNAPVVRSLAPTKVRRQRQVVADVAKLSVGREDYYLRELATDHEQYLSGHGESPGRWYGAGAANLGLEGEASSAGFRRMFEGRHPDTGELLGRAHGKGAVPAFDAVLRPTKSVSILYGLGDPATGRATLAAHHVGVREASAYPDQHLGTRRGHGPRGSAVRAGGRTAPPGSSHTAARQARSWGRSRDGRAHRCGAAGRTGRGRAGRPRRG